MSRAATAEHALAILLLNILISPPPFYFQIGTASPTLNLPSPLSTPSVEGLLMGLFKFNFSRIRTITILPGSLHKVSFIALYSFYFTVAFIFTVLEIPWSYTDPT